MRIVALAAFNMIPLSSLYDVVTTYLFASVVGGGSRARESVSLMKVVSAGSCVSWCSKLDLSEMLHSNTRRVVRGGRVWAAAIAGMHSSSM